MILDGKALAAQEREEVAAEVVAFKTKHGVVPTIAVVQVVGDPASERYVRQIGKSFEGVGMGFQHELLPADVSQAQVVELVSKLSHSRAVSGIIVQIPLPKHIAQEAVVGAIAPDKDVDGVNPINAGRLLAGAGNFFAPATPSGGMEILHRNDIPIAGRHAVVVGRSNIVGKPMALLLLHEHATVTICHSRTPDLAAITRQGDILVAAVGKARVIGADMVKPGATVIDFGVNIVDGKSVGDVDFDAAVQVASGITPVPGGTGPMTNIMLMRNTLRAAEISP